MRTRIAVVLLLIAPPAYAHGERLALLFLVAFFVVPGLFLVLTPWHRLTVRAFTLLLYAPLAFGMWRLMFAVRGAGPVLQWTIILAPAMFAVVAPMMIRVLYRRE